MQTVEVRGLRFVSFLDLLAEGVLRILLADGVGEGLQLARVGPGLPLPLQHRVLHYLILLKLALVRGQRALGTANLTHANLIARLRTLRQREQVLARQLLVDLGMLRGIIHPFVGIYVPVVPLIGSFRRHFLELHLNLYFNILVANGLLVLTCPDFLVLLRKKLRNRWLGAHERVCTGNAGA